MSWVVAIIKGRNMNWKVKRVFRNSVLSSILTYESGLRRNMHSEGSCDEFFNSCLCGHKNVQNAEWICKRGFKWWSYLAKLHPLMHCQVQYSLVNLRRSTSASKSLPNPRFDPFPSQLNWVASSFDRRLAMTLFVASPMSAPPPMLRWLTCKTEANYLHDHIPRVSSENKVPSSKNITKYRP